MFYSVGISGYTLTEKLIWYAHDTVFNNQHVPSDTLINGIKHYVIYSPFTNLLTFYKEDTTAGTLWAYSNGNFFGVDSILLMDASLNVGDTLKLLPMWWSGEVSFVCDSVFQKDGRQYQRFQDIRNSYVHDQFYVIEGIGNTKIMGTTVGDHYQMLLTLCVSNSDSMLYVNDVYDTCFMSNASVNKWISDHNLLNVFPNPASDEVNVELESANGQYSLVIRDVLGREVHRGMMHGNNNEVAKATLSVRALPPGLYTVEVLGHKRYVRKLRVL